MKDNTKDKTGQWSAAPQGRPTIQQALQKGLLVLDGAMGTMIQSYGLGETDFRGEMFKDVAFQMTGNNDILTLTRPGIIEDIHQRYLEAGADIITANTFSCQRISMADYHCEPYVAMLNTEAVKLARRVADRYSTPEWPRFVVATVGPTNKTLSMSPDVSNPAMRAVTYDEMRLAYTEQMEALFESQPDGILIETIFDTLNCKAAIHAYLDAREQTGKEIPLMLSVTVSGKAGRLLSGQTLEGFLASIQHAPVLSVGINCSFGALDMLPSLRALAGKAPYYISAHPNAGLPNSMGGYDQTPDMMLAEMGRFVDEGLVNIIGGCCGTTPAHIAKLTELRQRATVHVPAPQPHGMWLSGLELMEVPADGGIFVNVGERCNVAGSRKFLRLIKEKAYEEALSIARAQVEDGAMVIDVNMDDGLLDAREEMEEFLKRVGSEPDICRVPVMIDSSNWDVIRAGLKCVQGKSIVNSISLKEGEEKFLSHAREVKRMGAAVVVMAFDEQGQADTLERRIEVCQRAYKLLVEQAAFNPHDIIFDPNVLAVATGMPEHDGYARDFIEAARWIRTHLPGVHVSGGVSNLSFSFRGNNYLREAMHAVFLYHARQAGMDMGIVNPAAKVMYADIPHEELEVIERVVLHPSAEATEALIALASQLAAKAASSASAPAVAGTVAEETLPVDRRLVRALLQGRGDRLEADLQEALACFPRAVDIIEGPLMEGMNQVGQYFGEGKMFLPQVVKAARTMKQAVAILQPHIERQQSATGGKKAGKVLVATVKGDVHDIGKNIVSVVMACNGYEIIDLGVMVAPEVIVSETLSQRPDIIGLSGLITPSLEEMVRTVDMLAKAGIDIPVMIGGATTSALHTALRIAPVYAGPVVWVKDAAQNVPVANRFLHADTAETARAALQEEQESMRQEETARKKEPLASIEEARNRRPRIDF
ncbi:MAG: methionine synthase [Bacteroidaceae bacterium]